MYRSKKITVLFCAFLFWLNTANAQHALPVKLSLAQVWDKVTANSKTLKMQELNVQHALEGVKDAKAERLPELSAAAQYAQLSNLSIYADGVLNTPEQFEGMIHTSYSVGAEAYLNLYNGGKTKTKIATEIKENELAVAHKMLRTEEVKLRATAYYLNLQRSAIFKALLLKDIQTQEKQLEEINQLLKNGVILKSDVLRATLKLSRQKMALVEINNDMLITNQKLNILSGLPDEAIIVPEDGADAGLPVLQTYEDYLDYAMEHSPDFSISEKEAELSELHIKSVKSNAALKLGLFSHYSYSYPQILIFPYAAAPYLLGGVGLKASFPISAGYHNKHKVKAAEIEYKKQEIEHADTEDRIRQEVNTAFLRYKEALTRIEIARENIVQATENLRIVNNTYFNQLSLITDLLDADTQLLQTRFDYAAARIAAQLQYYQLQKAIGNF